MTQLPQPFWQSQDARHVIYCGDNAEILPRLVGSKIDLVCTDPPYNCGKDYGEHNDSTPYHEYDAWSAYRVNLCKSICNNQFWVAPRYHLTAWMGFLGNPHLIVIPRGATGPFRGGWSDQFEIALAMGKPSKCVPDLWTGIRLKGEGYFFREDSYGHPGYTPEPIMMRAIALLCSDCVCDPFLGTGTTSIAAVRLGKRSIGIELNRDYCAIAQERMERELAQPCLPALAPERPQQQELLT